jgi:hypothetical protein
MGRIWLGSTEFSMKFKSLVVASVVGLASVAGQAATVNWGPHDLLESALNLNGGGIFADTYTFSLASKSTVASSVSALGTLAPAMYSLFTVGGDGVVGTADDTGIAAWTFGGAPTVHTVTLNSGNYYYSVFAVSSAPAAYSINSAATAVAAPVPEPETYALFAAGLAVVGFVAVRRGRR